MKTRITIAALFTLLASLVITFPAMAQADNQGVTNPCDGLSGSDLETCEFGDGGGTGGGSGSGTCKTCDGDPVYGYICVIMQVATSSTLPYQVVGGQADCTAYNPGPGKQGPAYCQLSGPSCNGEWVSSRGKDAEWQRQSDAIAAFFLASKLMSRESLADWMGRVEDGLRDVRPEYAGMLRLKAYREEFRQLVGRELKPGAIPVVPTHRQIVTRATAL